MVQIEAVTLEHNDYWITAYWGVFYHISDAVKVALQGINE